MTASKKNLIHCAVMVILTFGIGFLPPLGGQITQLGMKILGVFVGMLYGWTFLGFFATSCFGLLALCLSGYNTIWNILGEGFSNMVALQVLCLFVLVAYLIESGFVELILGFFLTRKWTKGRPYVLIFTIFFACAITLMLGLGFGGVFFVWAVMYKMFDLLGYRKGDMLVTYMVYGAAVACGLSTMVFPFAVYPTMVIGFLAPFGISIPDIPWIIWNLLYNILFYLVYVLFGKFVLRLDVQAFIDKAEEVAGIYQGKKATKQQKLALWMMILFLFVTLAPSLLPAGAAKTFLAQFGMAGGVFLIVTITMFITIDGKPVTNWAKCAQEGINWDLLIMFVLTTPLANALESADSGILATVLAAIMPVLSGVSGHVFILIVCLVMCLITQFCHNIVVIMALSPTLLQIASQMGSVNMVLMMACILVACNAAFLTPGASAPAAAVHANTDWVDVKQAYVLGVAIILLALIVLAALYPLGVMIL